MPTPWPRSESGPPGYDRVADADLDVLRLLADRRRQIGEEHTRKVSQLHALLLELLPGGAKKDVSATQARALSVKGAAP